VKTGKLGACHSPMPLSLKETILPALVRRCVAWPHQALQLILVSSVAVFTKPITHSGIRLIASATERLDSLRRVGQALDLIERHDLRRFMRVQRSIKRVFLAPWKPLGVYYPIGRVCGVRDLSTAEPRNGSVVVLAYAYILIHGATQARFHRGMVAYTEADGIDGVGPP